MSNYQFKDLYVTLTPKAQGAVPFSNNCVVLNPYTPVNGPIHQTTDCSAGCFGWPVLPPVIGGTPFGFGVVQPYGSLKEYLKSALAAEEAREKALDESQKPQSVSEVEELEEKLKGALQELSVRKAELQPKK